MNLIKFFTVITAFAVTFTSCKKDKENPTVTIITPEEHSEFKWGEEVYINATLADDRNLKHVHSFVGDANGNHIHDFNFMVSKEYSGEAVSFLDHFVVPDNAPSVAWIYFQVKDTEDKQTETKWMLHFKE